MSVQEGEIPVEQQPATEQGAGEGTPAEEVKQGLEALFEQSVTEPTVETPPQDGGGEVDPLLAAMTEEVEAPYEGPIGGYTIKLPKGISKDDELLKQFTELAKKHDSKPEMVQQSVDLALKYQKMLVEQLVKREESYRRDLNNGWIRKNKDDPEYGGANYTANCNYALKAIRQLCSDKDYNAREEVDGYMGLKQYLERSNSTNATPLWKLLVNMGKRLSESGTRVPAATGVEEKPKTMADALYGGLL